MIRIGLWAARYYSLKMIPLSGLMMTAGTFMIESSWMKLKNVPLGLRPEGFYGQLQMRMIFEEFSITKEEDAIIVNAVYDRIEKAEIWIPYGEVLKHYRSIKVKLCRRIRSEADAGGKIHNQHPNQRVKFMNSNSLTARGVWQRLTR